MLLLRCLAGSTAMLLFFWGGGSFTYIVRHEPKWLWPNETVREINQTAQDIISPLVTK